MRNILLFFMGIMYFGCCAQYYYTPYQQQQMNQQAFEYGYRMMEQMQEQQAAQDARSVSGCLTRIRKAIARRQFEEAEDWAQKLLKLKRGTGYYYLGLTNELQGYGSYAKSYYKKGANINNKACQSELDRIAEDGFATEDLIDNVVNYFRQIEVMSSNMAADITNNIWGNSSNNGNSSYYENSPNRSRSAQKANCSICLGTGYEQRSYTYSASADSYHNSVGNSCSLCGRKTDHYHYRCRH